MNDIVPQPNVLLNFIERASRDESFDVAKFGELLRLQREELQDQARRAFDAAMARVQAEMEPIVRDARNEHLRSKYARLETIDLNIRPIYTRHGFSVRYGTDETAPDGMLMVNCVVAHDGGHCETKRIPVPVSALGSQGGRT